MIPEHVRQRVTDTGRILHLVTSQERAFSPAGIERLLNEASHLLIDVTEEMLALSEAAEENGRCDECYSPIVHPFPPGLYARRVCSHDATHDCYSDDYNNGGDPYPNAQEEQNT